MSVMDYWVLAQILVEIVDSLDRIGLDDEIQNIRFPFLGENAMLLSNCCQR